MKRFFGDGPERTLGSRRRRRLLGLLFLLAAMGTSIGAVYALLSTTGTGTGSASTGSVALNVNEPVSHACSYDLLIPGDLTGLASETCVLSVTYTGSIDAYVSLTVAIRTEAGSGGTALYPGDNLNGLTFTISDDGGRSFTVPANPGFSGVTGGTCPAGFTCWTAANDLAAWYTGSTTPNLTFTGHPTVTWTVAPHFPTSAGNPYQGGIAALDLTVEAVQAAANPLPAGCTVATIGRPCLAGNDFSWS